MMPAMSTDFGRRLKAARKNAGLVQKDLAPLVGMSQSNLSDLENTAHESGKTIQLALACGVNPIWLATGEGEMLDPLIVQARGPKAAGVAAPSLVRALVDRLGTLPPARWPSVRAQLDQLVAHPESRDDVLGELQLLLQTPSEKRQGNG